MPKEDELWAEYEQKKAELEEYFIKKKVSKGDSDAEYHNAFRKLYLKYYNTAQKEIKKENERELLRIRKQNKLLESREGPFYSEKPEK
jgi:hypothetical protein